VELDVVAFENGVAGARVVQVQKIFVTSQRGHHGSGRHGVAFVVVDSVDYAIVLAGEIYALMDEGEVLLNAGDVLVQRGTNHAWSNRTDQPTYIAFVLIDGQR